MAKEDDNRGREFANLNGKDLSTISNAINKYLKSNVGTIASEIKDFDNAYTFKYPTNILSLDKYLGTGGIYGGRIVDIHGWQGAGKTLTCLTLGAAVQAMPIVDSLNPSGSGRVAMLDAEATFSPDMARAVGIDTEKLLLFRSTPEKILTGEDYFAIMGILIQAGVELIIVDSAPALIPSSRLTATVGQGQKATQAQLMSEGLQQITSLLNAYKRSVVIFINQMRQKPMVMFGPSEDHTGGNALKFYASYSLEVKKVDDIIKKVKTPRGTFEESRIGASIKTTLRKNKTALIPVESISWDIYFTEAEDKDGYIYKPGVDILKDLVDVAIADGVIVQTSSWFTYGDIKALGKDKLIDALRAGGQPLLERIRNDVLNGKQQEKV